MLNGCPRISHPNRLLFAGFPPSPCLARQFIRCFDSEWRAVKVCPSCQSRIVVDWSLSCKPASGAYPLEYVRGLCTTFASALELVRCFGFALPLRVDGRACCYVPVLFSCGSGAYSKDYL